jgi:hypothetical protein
VIRRVAGSGAVEELLGDVAALGDAPTLLVACGFEGALAPPGDDRALQQSSEALNVLLALPGTAVAVISRRSPDEVSELMFLSGAKGGLRMVTPEEVDALRRELDAVALVVDVDPAALAGLTSADLGVLVDEDADPDADPEEERRYRVGGAEDVVDVLEELVSARR